MSLISPEVKSVEQIKKKL